MSEILIEVYRGEFVESIHRGNIVVIKSDGNILNSLGEHNYTTFMRSASKPVQAIAALECGIVERYGLDLAEIAILMSSHSGEKIHIDVLNSILEKIGIEKDILHCGAHDPLGIEAARELISNGLSPTMLHCNCSGKHLAQIAAAKIKGFSLEDYYRPNNGLQSFIRNTILQFSGAKEEQIHMGIDGCGVPVYCMPLENMALAYANLCNENFMDGRYKKSQNYVISAMTVHPEMIGGRGRFDTGLMSRFGDRLIGKFGDEGIYCVGLIGKGIGIALKIEDGHTRAVGPAVLETLRQLGVVSTEELTPLKDFWNPPIKNHRGEIVGEIRASFTLRNGAVSGTNYDMFDKTLCL